MKNGQACPKCRAQEVFHVPGKSQQTGYDDGPNIREKKIGPGRIYVEAWVALPEELEKVRKRFG